LPGAAIPTRGNSGQGCNDSCICACRGAEVAIVCAWKLSDNWVVSVLALHAVVVCWGHGYQAPYILDTDTKRCNCSDAHCYTASALYHLTSTGYDFLLTAPTIWSGGKGQHVCPFQE
jgi:hypothetical protein